MCSLIIKDAESAGAIDDCKKIDNQKFKEIFQFSYKGGQKGLQVNIPFVGNTPKFKIDKCDFQLIDGKYFMPGRTNFIRMQQRNKLNNLQPCTKYKIELKIKNLATKTDLMYENFVTTKPEGSMALEIVAENVTDTSVNFTTKSVSADACFVRFHLSVKNDLKELIFDNSTIDEKIVNLPNLSPSKTYTAQIFAFDDKGSKITTNIVNFKTKSSDNCNEIDPNISINIKNITSDAVSLKWTSDSPENIYNIEILDKIGNSIFNSKFSNNSATIDNLKACCDYNVRLSIPCATKTVTKNFQTLKSRPGEVRDIHFDSNHTHSMISWTAPDTNFECVINYMVEVGKQKVTVDKQKTSITLSKLPYSMKLPVHVNVNWDTSNETVVKSSEFEHIDFDKFIVDNIAEFRLSPTELQLRWSNSIEIIKEFQVFHDGKMFTSDQTLINLEIDACRKNYTVMIRCVSNGGNFGPNVSYHTNLDDDSVPLSAISDTAFSFTQTNEKLLISWIPNMKEAPCINHYNVLLNDQNFKTDQPNTVLNDFLPCITYRIQVTPIAETGTRGETTNYEFTTNVIAPKAPSKPEMIKNGNHEFKISTTLSYEDKYCISLSPTFVIFECNGKRVEEKIEGDKASHAAVIPNLKPNTDYKCTAFVRNSEGISAVSEPGRFKTLEDSPQAPANINYQINSDNTVNISWSPDNSSSYIVYNLHLTLKRNIYEQPENCSKVLQYRTVNTTESHYLFRDLAAFVEYTLNIYAINGNGRSNASKEIPIFTNPSPSSQVRDIKLNFNKIPNSLSAVLKWKSPCNMNGKFSFYLVSVKGSRKGCESVNEILASQGNEIEFKNIKPGFKYEVEIQAKVHKFAESGEIIGESAKFSFVAPSEIPLEKDLEDWTNSFTSSVDPKNIEILLKRSIFVSSIGDITGIAFMIFLANCPDLPQPSFGYVSEHNFKLPPASSQNLFNCSQLYQQTEILQNKITHDNESDSSSNLDAFNILYVLGDEKCDMKTNKSYCNGPLLVGVEYGLMARLFTADAFRDTLPIYFRTKYEDSPLMSPMILVAGSLSTLILISIVICLCCWCSLKKQKKFKKKKETAETVDNLLSFTSYCVIDKNPVPRGQFDHLL